MARRRLIAIIAVLTLTMCGLAAALGFTLAVQTSSVTTEVRVNARQLTDGRIEFALQQRDGAGWSDRILTAGRYFPANVNHNRWVASSPFTISLGAPVDDVGDMMEEEETPSVPVRTLGSQQPISTSLKPPHHPSELGHDLGNHRPGAHSRSTLTTSLGQWHYFTVRGQVKDAVLGCRDNGGEVYAWRDNGWHDDEISVLRAAQLPEDHISYFAHHDVAPYCGAEIDHLALFPEWEPEAHEDQPILLTQGWNPPGDGSRWLVQYTMTASTSDPAYEWASLMLGCLPGTNLPGVKIWAWSRQNGGSYGKPHPASATNASFSSGVSHTFVHGPEYAVLTGDDARTFLGHMQRHDEVAFSIPMNRGSILSTFNLRGGGIDDSTVAMLMNACYSQTPTELDPDGIVRGPVGFDGDDSDFIPATEGGPPNDQPTAADSATAMGSGHGSAWIYGEGPHGRVDPRLSVVCNGQGWIVHVETNGHQLKRGGGYERISITLPRGWSVELEGRTYTFMWDNVNRRSELKGSDARDFWRAAERAGTLTLRISSTITYTFDVSEVDSDSWGCE